MANSSKKVRKVVIPAAGFGTRFLPATKAQPKEMLPIVDKPIIQYVVEQAVEAGIEEIIIVTGWHKRAIEDHFDKHFELEARLEKDGKSQQLEEIRKISELGNFVYVRQKEPLGNGHAVLVAKDIVGDEPFLVMWGDEFFKADPVAAKQLIEAYEEYNAPVIAGIRIEKKDLSKYGIADVTPVAGNIFKINKIVEKPDPDRAPSNLATHGSYLFTHDIFEILENLKPGMDGEIWIADAIDELISKRDVYAVELKNAKYYDCGSKVSYLKAVVDHGLAHEDTNGEFRAYLKSLKL
ncbi:UTP--glucose-1-phosphate uridylyltransferase [Candidatus Curtissbacteria bacterium RIFCSPHIGHO2_01_FULL_41_44]|uniref:UTP--glucose-1-phosphate uridylyltransferase n=1 Tax=Candidatus Curtissbacteria bacterium RIFCSPLOWO2_01_FULL_42_50 TaxID=1797730 RepID=A0A1F5H5R0_9BACT|nr:MAG: UTP--glucose-1-phosphate uridylyltransferase [Candidatus Curtissbacteria bacterium RIFCSPHIGHO2_01_FULL_41_44]OGD93799.1 MAG: UTP--glucose-1-phosphate uridylyltransferase [Candidatus Curtissbacteria bacterium RIFCSPHIGHO2_02_FULL_42_58]OGD97806.1 MAG: UTP--glucose-1-phosphate uridylyltransferase [Candidatus Curtissbacteria bacterium RIFCSPHIGHO2_12_FULL_42_33]OGD99441.1 MAG: UTP--glucose-1-phosphate uridylyltransferase [Candidatus Curtissbacteria bacterium RIFCSPLOWO2_01_FULL_42_50]OGE0